MSSWKCIAAVFVGGWLGSCGLLAQDASSSQAPSASQAPAASQVPQAKPGTTTTDEPPPTQGTGKVLFSRSDEDDKVAASTKQDEASKQPASSASAASQGTAEERGSLTFLTYDLDVHLTPRQESLAARARMTVRNDGEKPLRRIALQLSSTLKWERIRAGGVELKFAQHPLDSDADHTGSVNEAVATLPRELAPKEELKLEVFYSGQVSLGAERLERIGAPTMVAERSDWDRVSPDFIGLRGFGNVVWYPVSALPALLGDGAKLFAEIGRQKQRQQQAQVTMKLTSEYSEDAPAPNLAVLDGRVVPVVQTSAPENSYPGIVTASLPAIVLGFATPSFFLLNRQKVDGNGMNVFAAAEDLGGAQAYVTAVNLVTPIVQQWLGPTPKTSLAVVGLPDPGDIAAEEGDAYFTGFKATPDPKELENAMVHSLAHVYFHLPRVWLNEGVPQFLGSLWIEQIEGRSAALESMGAGRGALALAEPGTPGEAGGENLIDASNIVFYRTKATYVLWMLRDLVGDARLAAALRAYAAADDTTPEYFEQLLEKSTGKDLKWFFDSWVYQDRGLPDLSITGVFPSKAAAEGQWLVALDISNDGYAETEVPVTLRSKDATVTERLRIPPRGKVSRRMLIGGVPTEVQVNDGTVPEDSDSIHLKKLSGDVLQN